jgi:hypothetical protein
LASRLIDVALRARTAATLKFKPREADFAIYQIGLRLGLQFDLGPVNFDFNYTLGLNSFTKTDYRTSSHVTQFNLGWLF